MISALILTRNEEQDLPGCLASIAWCDDIHVLDSHSTDRTVEIAQQGGCTVTTRSFDGYASQRNAALRLPYRHRWVLVLDADERPTPELCTEMQAAIRIATPATAAFRLRRRDYLWGTWLKHAQLTPFYVRLLRPECVRYTREINEIAEVDGEIAELHGTLEHLAFSKGIGHWVSKHNDYSTREAQLLASGAAVHAASLSQAFFARDFGQRRVAQKAIFYKLPGRPLLKWLFMIFVRRAVLDGRAGVAYATLQAFYEYLIEVKRRELQRKGAGQPI